MSKRTGWGREFDDPIELPDGGELVTLKDGGNYIMKLPRPSTKRRNGRQQGKQ